MDAASAAAAIVGLVFNCATAIKGCHDLLGKFRNADRTLRSMATEASTLRSALLQLQHLMMLDPIALSSRWDMESMLPQTFETAIDGFRDMLAVLVGHLEGLTRKCRAKGSPLTRAAKRKMMWNEAEMQDVLVQVRAQQHSLHFLLTILQMGSISEIRKGIRENQQLLQNLATSARELKSKSSESLIEKLSAMYREHTEFNSDESDDEAESGSDSDEPPAKRRSLSPEDDSLPEAGRTRSGRTYQPNMTEASLDTRQEVNLLPPSMEGAPRSIASKKFQYQTLYGITSRPTQQVPDKSYATSDIKARHLKGLKAKSSPKESVNQKKIPELTIGLDALGQDQNSDCFKYATPPPSLGSLCASAEFFDVDDYSKWQIKDLPSYKTADATTRLGEPSDAARKQTPQGCITPLRIPTKTEVQHHAPQLMPQPISRIDKRNDNKRQYMSKISGVSGSKNEFEAVTQSPKDSGYKIKNEKRTARSLASRESKPPPNPPSNATEADARKHGIPVGYSLKNWDPTEEPIIILGSVFDAYSLGKWIYDWTVYHKGPDTPFSERADELWLLLSQLVRKVKSAKETIPRIRLDENRELVDDFVESAERLTDKLKKLLKTYEQPMLKAGKGIENGKLRKKAGTEFVDMLFGTERISEGTEKFMSSLRLWNLRFDANCEDILQRPYI